MDTTTRATAIGMLAPILWGMSVGMMRGITENLGVSAGIMVVYLIAFFAVLLFFGRPNFRAFNPKYLIFGVGSANLSAVCFVFSLAISDGGHQTMEVGMVNYLWPCLTILFAILFNGQKAHWWVVIGLVMCLMGVVIVLGGDKGFDPEALLANIRHNPWCYVLAATGALLWAAYCSFTRALSNGQNPVVIIFAVDALIFALVWLLDLGPAPVANPHGFGWMGVVITALATGCGYSCWTYGMMKGHMTLLAIVSYFTPVLSCLFGNLILDAQLGSSFWSGVLILVAGSFVCWLATRVKAGPAARPGKVLFKGSDAGRGR